MAALVIILGERGLGLPERGGDPAAGVFRKAIGGDKGVGRKFVEPSKGTERSEMNAETSAGATDEEVSSDCEPIEDREPFVKLARSEERRLLAA